MIIYYIEGGFIWFGSNRSFGNTKTTTVSIFLVCMYVSSQFVEYVLFYKSWLYVNTKAPI